MKESKHGFLTPTHTHMCIYQMYVYRTHMCIYQMYVNRTHMCIY